MPADHALSAIEDLHQLDYKERLNTSSYVNVVFEKAEKEAALIGLAINIADQTVYPQSYALHNMVVNMVAQLWNCPKPHDFDAAGCYPGAGTVGSTEACLLAGLALKFRWRAWYATQFGKSAQQMLREVPNLVISTLYQAAWEKFFRFMDVEPRFVRPTVKHPQNGGWSMPPSEVAAAIDDHTIGVVCIMGNHYSGHYDDVQAVAAAVKEANAAKKTAVVVHVDAASGGFVAPFQRALPPWDFRVPEV